MEDIRDQKQKIIEDKLEVKNSNVFLNITKKLFKLYWKKTLYFGIILIILLFPQKIGGFLGNWLNEFYTSFNDNLK